MNDVACSECGAFLNVGVGSFWREPILFCDHCKTHFGRESRFTRALAWFFVLLFTAFAIVGWVATIYLVAGLLSNGIRDLGFWFSILVLAALSAYLSSGIVSSFRDLTAEREYVSLEK